MWWRKASEICPFHLFVPQLMQLSICILMLLLTLSRMEKGRSIISQHRRAGYLKLGELSLYFFCIDIPIFGWNLSVFRETLPHSNQKCIFGNREIERPSEKLATKQSVKSWILDYCRRQKKSNLSFSVYISEHSFHASHHWWPAGLRMLWENSQAGAS